MTELWKPVVGFEALYEVSDKGSVRSIPREFIRSNGKPFKLNGRTLKPERNKDGHMRVALANRGNITRKFVHVIMLETFIGPRPEGAVSCHWNDIGDDNRLENLRWGTRADNGDDMVRNGNGFNSRKTHCPQGHAYDEENTYIKSGSRNGKPSRSCNTCNRESQRRRRNSMTDAERDEWHAKRRANYRDRRAN